MSRKGSPASTAFAPPSAGGVSASVCDPSSRRAGASFARADADMLEAAALLRDKDHGWRPRNSVESPRCRCSCFRGCARSEETDHPTTSPINRIIACYLAAEARPLPGRGRPLRNTGGWLAVLAAASIRAAGTRLRVVGDRWSLKPRCRPRFAPELCNGLLRERDLFGQWATRWRIIRTSSAYLFRDPLPSNARYERCAGGRLGGSGAVELSANESSVHCVKVPEQY